MALPSSANAGKPSVAFRFQCDARSDRFNRCLKTLKIPFRPESDDTPTIRTPIKLEQQRLYVPVKNSFGKTMAPQPVAVATWTTVRLLPWIISSLFEKILEFDSKKHYHFIVPCGPGKAHFSCKGGSLIFSGSPPLPFKIKKASFLRPIYFDNRFLLVNRF